MVRSWLLSQSVSYMMYLHLFQPLPSNFVAGDADVSFCWDMHVEPMCGLRSCSFNEFRAIRVRYS